MNTLWTKKMVTGLAQDLRVIREATTDSQLSEHKEAFDIESEMPNYTDDIQLIKGIRRWAIVTSLSISRRTTK